MTITTLYKIRNTINNKFSIGGGLPSFNTIGKVWKIGQLKSHLRLVGNIKRNYDIYKDCELVSYTEILEPATIALSDLIEPLEKELIVTKLKYGY